MFWRMVFGALWRQKRKMSMITLTVALGVSLSTALLNVMLDVGDKVNRELKTYGANINVLPQNASLLNDLYGVESTGCREYLNESDIPKIKTIFWGFNIVDFAPFLEVPAIVDDQQVTIVGTWFNHHLDLPTGETLDTGIKNLRTWWDIEGEWIAGDSDNQAMVGSTLAQQMKIEVGDSLTLTEYFPPDSSSTYSVSDGLSNPIVTVTGIFTSGENFDEQIMVALPIAQEVANIKNQIDSLEISALTTPDNDLARKAAQNPNSLSVKEYETWYCTAYVSAITYQIEEVWPNARAKAIRQVAESEGAILEKTELLMLLLTILSLFGVALAISNLATASVMERSRELGLMKSIGALNFPITRLVLSEVLLTGLIGGIVGYLSGLAFAQIIGQSVFGSAIAIKPLVLPIVVFLTTVVILLGSIPAIRLLLRLDPNQVLHGK
ncbi:MAG: ABC transporter permease [Bifidobacteriaceae bacterium]|jgi:putative ABC transport system permease protein|nr:ABC transporter permease [Bifidobacteriaceae bacterium]